MAEPFSLEIITPERGVQKLLCESLSVQLADGSAGFLKDHAPFLGVLPAGEISLVVEGEKMRCRIGEAFLKFSAAGAELFTDSCETL